MREKSTKDAAIVVRPPRTQRTSYLDDVQIVVTPSSFTVEHEYKPLIYLPDGKVLVRRAGF